MLPSVFNNLNNTILCNIYFCQTEIYTKAIELNNYIHVKFPIMFISFGALMFSVSIFCYLKHELITNYLIENELDKYFSSKLLIFYFYICGIVALLLAVYFIYNGVNIATLT